MFWFVILLASSAVGSDETVRPAPAVRTEPVEGGGVRLVPDRQVPPRTDGADSVVLEFGDISLYDLALYFADLMRRNLLISDPATLKGKRVQMIGHESMSADEAWQAFRSTLHAHDLTTAEIGGVVSIVPSRDAAREPLRVGSGDPSSREGFVTQLLPLTNARAESLIEVVRPLLSEGAPISAYAPTNTLIVTDTAANIHKIHELVSEINVADAPHTLVHTPLAFASAAQLRAAVEALYPLEEPAHKATPQPAPRKTRRSKPSPTTPTVAGSEDRQISKILDDERTNSLFVLANPEGHRAVAELVEVLDVDADAASRKRLEIVYLKYAMAEELAAVLEGLSSASGSSTPARPAGKGRGKDPEASPDLAEVLDGDVRIAADPATNALALLADRDELQLLSTLIQGLDVVRGQVFVDAVFVELTHTGGRELGIATHVLPGADQPLLGSAQLDPDGSLSSFSVTPELLSGLAAGVFGPTIEVAAADGSLLQVPTFGIALRALQTNSDVQVMGNPALLALDHQEATLSVGRKIPFASSSQTNALGSPIVTYDRMDVAMDLTVTPHINDDALVTLDIELSVDEVEGGSAESELSGGPVTSSRTVQSRVMVDDGQTIVLAGLVGTKLDVAESKIPILGDIPLIGALFRGRSRETRQTHLMVFLTPHVVQTPSDLLEIRQIKEAQRQEFVRRFQGRDGRTWLAELQQLLTSPAGGAP